MLSASLFHEQIAAHPQLLQTLQVFTGHSGPVRCGRFTPDGKSIVTGGGEGDDSLKVWDPRNGACTLSVHDAHSFHSAGDLQGHELELMLAAWRTTARSMSNQKETGACFVVW